MDYGFKSGTSKVQTTKSIEDNRVLQLLNEVTVKLGNFFTSSKLKCIMAQSIPASHLLLCRMKSSKAHQQLIRLHESIIALKPNIDADSLYDKEECKLKALFLAGGQGTRLRPLTDRLPKPMVPVMGLPLLERSFKRLQTFGVREIVLSTCYKPECIEKYFGNGADYGLQIYYICEDVPLGTGGAIKNARSILGNEPFLVFNADIINDINYREMMRFHVRKKAEVTIAATWVENPSSYGVIEYDDQGYAVTFREKPQPHEIVSHYINAGVYIFEPDVLKQIPSGRPVSVEREVFPKLLKKGKRIAVYKGCNYWLDLGTPEKYMQAHLDAFKGLYRIDEADFERDPIYGFFNAKISRKAMLQGPVYLGKDVRIEAGAVVGPNAVIGRRSYIGKKCRIENSILWNDVTVENGVEIVDSIVTDDCIVERSSPYENMIFTGESTKRLAIS